MSDKTKLLPCPCCAGEAKEMYTYLTSVEWVACLKCGLETKGFGNAEAAAEAWNCRIAAPDEDVRAVVEEPVGNEQTAYLILFDDYDVRPETVIGEDSARQRFAQLSNSWNAHLFVKLESNSRDDAHAESNYRHPQRPVVLPDRRTPDSYPVLQTTLSAQPSGTPASTK